VGLAHCAGDGTQGKKLDEFQYSAFISYRHSPLDRKWARWFLEKLETYRTPRAQVKAGTPQRIGHLYRDDDEVPASSDLSSEIRAALDASEFLLVICSPSTPRSKWIRQEIEYFRSLGRGNRILAVLVDGEPNEAFPSNLRIDISDDSATSSSAMPQEPIAADVRPQPDERPSQTRHRALLRIAAALLHCRFDDLAERDRQRRLRQQRSIGALTIVVVAGVLTGLYAFWKYNRIDYQYFASSESRWNIPTGVGPLTKSGASRRYNSVELGYQRGRVVRYRIVNGHGRTWVGGDQRDFNNGAVEWRISYLDGKDAEIKLYGADGELRGSRSLRFDPHDPSKAILRLSSPAGSAKPLAANFSSLIGRVDWNVPAPRSAISQAKLLFSADGRLLERNFQDAYGEPAADAQGSYGERFSTLRDGLETQRSNVDRDGKVLIEKNGVASTVTETDALRDVLKVTWLNEKGQPTAGDGESAFLVSTLDAAGNSIVMRSFGEDGRPARNRFGFHRSTLNYNEFGDIVGTACFDVEGIPALAPDFFHASVKTYDDHGNGTSLRLYGVDGKPTVSKPTGCHGENTRYDQDDRVVESFRIGVAGEPCLASDGVMRQQTTYDRLGNIVEVRNLDAQGKLLTDAVWIAIYRYGYDSDGNRTSEAYFGPDGSPVFSAGGYSSIKYEYRQGNVVRQSVFDHSGKPTIDIANGAAEARVEYDRFGNLLSVASYGTDGQRVVAKLGWAIAKLEYDSRGNRIAADYFDTEGQRVTPPQGAAAARWTYDDRNRITSFHLLDPDLKPFVAQATGFATARISNDDAARITTVSVFDAEDRPVSSAKFCATTKSQYDVRGQTVATECFGVDGQRALNNEGVWRLEQTYDEHGNQIEWRSIGKDGKPANDVNGVAKAELSFNLAGKPVRTRFFDASGRPNVSKEAGYVSATATYDARGNKIERRFFGADGRPATNSDGVSIEKKTYDDFGRQLTDAFFDANGVPVSSRHGYSTNVMTYDRRGNMLTDAYYDTAGRLTVAAKDSTIVAEYAKAVWEYDERDNQTRESFYGPDGKPALSQLGYAFSVSKYDSSGRIVDASLFDPNGKPISIKGIPLFNNIPGARFQASYSRDGRLKRLNIYDADGSLRGGIDGPGH
jgi:hypothetical protein